MKLDEIREAVFLKKPHFGDVLHAWGDSTLLEYYTQDFSPLYTPTTDVLNAIQYETELILGAQIGRQTYETVREKKWVNTADHHGLLCHPYFYTTGLARSHSMVRRKNEVTVTLPFGGVSLGNDSFPRGFFFHTASGEVERIFFKSLKERRLPVYALSPVRREDFLKERDRARSFDLSERAQSRLQMLLTLFVEDTRIWNQDTYSAQLTIMNSVLWHALFGQTRGEFVYLEIERVATRLILLKHVSTDTPIFNLLFNPLWRSAFVELFSGVFGSHDAHSGTHLFWYIDYVKMTRRGLRIEDDMLTTVDRDVEIPLTPEAISEGIRSRTLMPSTALMLILIHGVEKLACGGGPSQLTYLTVMMERWNALLSRFGVTEEVPATNIYCGDNTLFQVLSPKTNVGSLATSIDILLYGDDIPKCVDDALLATPLRVTVDAMLPTLHHLYTKEIMSTELPSTLPKIFIN